jgi:hypothetical protein
MYIRNAVYVIYINRYICILYLGYVVCILYVLYRKYCIYLATSLAHVFGLELLVLWDLKVLRN